MYQITGWRGKGLLLAPQCENTAFCFCVHIGLLQLTELAKVLPGSSLKRPGPGGDWLIPGISQQCSFTDGQSSSVPLPFTIRGTSSEESPRLPSPHCTFLPVPARSPQTDTDVGSPPSKLKTVVAQCRPQAASDSSGGGLSHCCSCTAPSPQSQPAVHGRLCQHRPCPTVPSCSLTPAGYRFCSPATHQRYTGG